MTSSRNPAPGCRPRGRVAGAFAAALLGLLLAGCGGAVAPVAALPAPGPSTVAIDEPGIAPASLELPDQAAAARVLPSATAPTGELAVPEDPQLLGWWVGGARVGAGSGTAVIAGHVDSAEAGLGTFAALREMEVGDPITVTAADGEAARFVAVAVTQYGKQELPRELFTRDGAPRLALITCTGDFDPQAGSYADNLVVLAEPVP